MKESIDWEWKVRFEYSGLTEGTNDRVGVEISERRRRGKRSVIFEEENIVSARKDEKGEMLDVSATFRLKG